MEARLAEKDAEIDIQQRELQTLRVHNYFKFGFCAVTVFCSVIRYKSQPRMRN